MSTLHISLPEALKSFVDEQVTQRGYGTSSDYVRELIRKELDRTNMRALLQEGVASPVVGELDAPYFNSLRERANARAAK